MIEINAVVVIPLILIVLEAELFEIISLKKCNDSKVRESKV